MYRKASNFANFYFCKFFPPASAKMKTHTYLPFVSTSKFCKLRKSKQTNKQTSKIVLNWQSAKKYLMWKIKVLLYHVSSMTWRDELFSDIQMMLCCVVLLIYICWTRLAYKHRKRVTWWIKPTVLCFTVSSCRFIIVPICKHKMTCQLCDKFLALQIVRVWLTSSRKCITSKISSSKQMTALKIYRNIKWFSFVHLRPSVKHNTIISILWQFLEGVGS